MTHYIIQMKDGHIQRSEYIREFRICIFIRRVETFGVNHVPLGGGQPQTVATGAGLSRLVVGQETSPAAVSGDEPNYS